MKYASQVFVLPTFDTLLTAEGGGALRGPED